MRAGYIRSILSAMGNLLFGEPPINGLLADPAFRSSLMIAATTLSIFAATAFLMQLKWDSSVTRILRIISATSGGFAVVAIMVGILASGR